MCSAFPSVRWLAVAVLAALAVSGCERETRRFRELPPTATAETAVRLSPLQPGPPVRQVRFNIGQREAAEADRCVIGAKREREESETRLADAAAVAIEKSVGLGAAAAVGEELHDRRIAVDRGEEIAVSPASRGPSTAPFRR